MGWAKEAASWSAVAIAAALGNFLLGCYCGGYGGRGGDYYVSETEPNDSPSQATYIGDGAYEPMFDGHCDGLTDEDWFATASYTTGYLFAKVTWKVDEYDLDLAVVGSGFAFSDTAAPPNDSPIELGGTVTTAGQIYLHITCNEALPDGEPVKYKGYVSGP